jgi:hypothetical protein
VAQVPADPGRSHDSQTPSHAEPQQTPSVQMPPRQSAATVQAAPWAKQEAPSSVAPSQSSSIPSHVSGLD